MRLYLICRTKVRHGYEVLDYDAENHTAKLRGLDGEVYEDKQFHLKDLRRFYDLAQTPPSWWPEN